jgi:hypothetical protein
MLIQDSSGGRGGYSARLVLCLPSALVSFKDGGNHLPSSEADFHCFNVHYSELYNVAAAVQYSCCQWATVATQVAALGTMLQIVCLTQLLRTERCTQYSSLKTKYRRSICGWSLSICTNCWCWWLNDCSLCRSCERTSCKMSSGTPVKGLSEGVMPHVF